MGTYYDLDAILTDTQKVPLTMDTTAPHLGHLDGNAGGALRAGSKVALPLWLGEMLAVSAGAGAAPLATLDLPAALGPRVVNALRADPRVVDLRAQAPHFYGLGARMLELFEEDELVDVLAETFKRRAADIADHAHNARSGGVGDGLEFLRGLDETERQLFRAAHDSAKATRRWLAEAQRS